MFCSVHIYIIIYTPPIFRFVFLSLFPFDNKSNEVIFKKNFFETKAKIFFSKVFFYKYFYTVVVIHLEVYTTCIILNFSYTKSQN